MFFFQQKTYFIKNNKQKIYIVRLEFSLSSYFLLHFHHFSFFSLHVIMKFNDSNFFSHICIFLFTSNLLVFFSFIQWIFCSSNFTNIYLVYFSDFLCFFFFIFLQNSLLISLYIVFKHFKILLHNTIFIFFY